MLALDRPYIASSAESAIETSDAFYLEYGTATQSYLVPFVQHEEQVSYLSSCERVISIYNIELTSVYLRSVYHQRKIEIKDQGCMLQLSLHKVPEFLK